MSKGSKGFLIYAYNNEQHDYFKHAVFAADRISNFLDKPVTIVTDEQSINNRKTGYNIIIKDSEARGKRLMEHGKDSQATWKNANRHSAYNITPYDRTIVIDSDYIVSSDILNTLFYSDKDFLCHRTVHDVTCRDSFAGDNTFGQFKMPHYWATVMYFRKSVLAEEIFNNMAMIKDSWNFFADLYKFDPSLYRNDYALSIALLMAYGHRQDAIPSISWRLFTSASDIKVEQYKKISFIFHYEILENNKVTLKRNLISGNDLHCLNKYALEDMIND